MPKTKKPAVLKSINNGNRNKSITKYESQKIMQNQIGGALRTPKPTAD